MPYEIKRVGKGYKIVNMETGKEYSKKPISKEKATAQERLLRAIEHGFKPSK